MAAPSSTGPGILWVTSKIVQPEHLSESTYLSWYDNEHIPEILSVTPVTSLFRFRHVDPKADRPYLVTCPLQNITDAGEFRKTSVKSAILPDENGVGWKST